MYSLAQCKDCVVAGAILSDFLFRTHVQETTDGMEIAGPTYLLLWPEVEEFN